MARSRVPRVRIRCVECGDSFEVAPGRARYRKCCSSSCGSRRARAAKRKVPRVELTCAFCGEVFLRRKSQLRKSRHGVYFCCKEHKAQGQRLGGVEKIHPPHYGSGRSSIATMKAREIVKAPGVCGRCGWKRYPDTLQVHHKDRDRDNNTAENLELLCPTCHEVEHYLNQDGRFFHRRSIA